MAAQPRHIVLPAPRVPGRITLHPDLRSRHLEQQRPLPGSGERRLGVSRSSSGGRFLTGRVGGSEWGLGVTQASACWAGLRMTPMWFTGSERDPEPVWPFGGRGPASNTSHPGVLGRPPPSLPARTPHPGSTAPPTALGRECALDEEPSPWRRLLVLLATFRGLALRLLACPPVQWCPRPAFSRSWQADVGVRVRRRPRGRPIFGPWISTQRQCSRRELSSSRGSAVSVSAVTQDKFTSFGGDLLTRQWE